MTLEWPEDAGDLAAWLERQVQRAPALMQEIALVLKPAQGIDENAIQSAVDALDALDIDLIGLTGDLGHRGVADRLGLPWLSANNLTEVVLPERVEIPVDTPPTEGAPAPSALVVEGPIRSGVQIYAKNRDLIVLGQVSAGAEVMADGHVHVYGRLFGRAAAGVSGQEDASVFCQHFEPQLISVAGLYIGSDQMPEQYRGAAIRAALDSTGNALTFTELT